MCGQAYYYYYYLQCVHMYFKNKTWLPSSYLAGETSRRGQFLRTLRCLHALNIIRVVCDVDITESSTETCLLYIYVYSTDITIPDNAWLLSNNSQMKGRRAVLTRMVVCLYTKHTQAHLHTHTHRGVSLHSRSHSSLESYVWGGGGGEE